jgi:virginiamycin B lyase
MATWKKVSGSLVAISAGSRTDVWGIDPAGSIYRYTNYDANPWIKIDGGATDVGAAADGTVWHVNSGNETLPAHRRSARLTSWIRGCDCW